MRLTWELHAVPCHALPARSHRTLGVLRPCAAHQPVRGTQQWLAGRRSLHPSWHRQELQQQSGWQHRPGRWWPGRLRCEGDNDEGEKHGSGGSRRPPKKQSRRPLQWLRQALGGVRAQRFLRVTFNIGVLLMLMRFWPLTGRNPLTGDATSIPIEACMHGPLPHALIVLSKGLLLPGVFASGASNWYGCSSLSKRVGSLKMLRAAHATPQVPFSTFVQNVRSNDVLAVVVEGRHVGFRLRPRSLARMLPKVCEAAWDTLDGHATSVPCSFPGYLTGTGASPAPAQS